ncbi:hypothetical protein [Paenibacillus qinlingensis]|uniref:Flagellar protein FliT n=1 Tax=Paenibacillus qinlingensis TaxID=1837343 RepID=A0ABU1P1G3_9BACL|nr:hypothetical protein [Paenibacillus qinlingensis]MDR6553573.1 hypothetical protein [Paenibacillus qinlingensis]
MKSVVLDELLNQLLQLTLSLEQVVSEKESDPELWVELVSQRQVIMDELTNLFREGVTLTETQKQTIMQPAYEMNIKIVALMTQEKDKMAAQIANLQRSKAVNDQYGGLGNASPYGAFFDKKK